MKTTPSITLILTACLLLPLTSLSQSNASTVKKSRPAPGPDPDLFDGSQLEAESRPESGIIADFEIGSGESSKRPLQIQSNQQQPGGQGRGGSGGGQIPQGKQQQGGGGSSSEMIEEGQQESDDFGEQGEKSQQGEQQQGQQGQQGKESSSSSEQGNQQAPTETVQLGDESLKIETVDLPADAELIGQKDDEKPEAKDVTGKTASGKQGSRRNTGVEQGDSMPSDL